MDRMHDSGARQQFATGAVRDTAEGKPRPDLASPFAMMRLGHWLALGAAKYSERNWEQGMAICRCVASLERHTLAYKMRQEDEDHMAAVMCNAMFILHFEAMIQRGVLPPELDDRPLYVPDQKVATFEDLSEAELRTLL
jgi:hypothetical protein